MIVVHSVIQYKDSSDVRPAWVWGNHYNGKKRVLRAYWRREPQGDARTYWYSYFWGPEYLPGFDIIKTVQDHVRFPILILSFFCDCEIFFVLLETKSR